MVKTLVIGWMALGLSVATGMSHAGIFAEMFIGASAIMERHAKPAETTMPAPPAPAAGRFPASDSTSRSPGGVAADAGSAGCVPAVASDSCNAKTDVESKAE